MRKAQCLSLVEKTPTTSLAYEDLFEGKTGEDVKGKPTAEKDKPRGEDGKSTRVELHQWMVKNILI